MKRTPKEASGEGWSFSEGDVEHRSKTAALNCPISLLTIAQLLWLVAANVLKLAVWILVSVACHFLTIMYAVLKIQGDSGHVTNVI